MHALVVPGHGDEAPLALSFVQSAHADLTPAHHLLDDPKHRVDRLLAPFVQRLARLRGQLVNHGGHRIRRLWRVRLGRKSRPQRFVMRLSFDRQQRLDPRLHAGPHVGLAEESVVSDQRLHLAQDIGQRSYLLQRGQHFALVVASLREVCGDHQHRVDVHPRPVRCSSARSLRQTRA